MKNKLNILIIFAVIALTSCSKHKITNETEARHFLATHKWFDKNAEFKRETGQADYLPSEIIFTDKDVTFNKETGAYNVVRKTGGDVQSKDPYFLITWYDNYTSEMLQFYLLEDGLAWLSSNRIKMRFGDNQGATVEELKETVNANNNQTIAPQAIYINKILTISVATAMVYRDANKNSTIETYMKNGEWAVGSATEKGDFIRVYFRHSNKYFGWLKKSDVTIGRDATPEDTLQEGAFVNTIAPEQSNKNTEQVITAKFTNVEVSDSYHLIFTADDGKTYDFGQGNNSYGKYDFGESKPNEKLLGNKFKITWKNNMASIITTDGQSKQAEVPTIIKIELIK